MYFFVFRFFYRLFIRIKKLLDFITVLSEVFVVFAAVYSSVVGEGACNQKYFLPSIIIVMILLFACRCVALQSISLLVSQANALRGAMREAVEARELADRSNQSKTVFLSRMSHDIRTPINAVLGLDEMIIRESNEESIRDYAMDIQSSGKSLLGLVNDVLDFSKIESGKLELVEVQYDLSSVVNDLVNMTSTRAYEKGLSFVVEVQPEIPHLLYGDEIRIKQVVMNLLSNAVKYTDRGEVKMCMSYRKIDEESIGLTIMVRDTGKGIKKEELDKLFTPFQRLDEGNNRNVEGTGLGMSIVKQLLALMDSELTVESVYELGSDFSFEIVQKVKSWKPVGNYADNYKRYKNKKIQYHEKFTAPDAKVLVVDDTPVNVKVFKGLLKQTLIQIDSAYSGIEGLRYARDNKYDMIFVDHMMPGMDGVEMIKQLKEEASQNQDVPIIALTANAISGCRDFYLQNGFSEYLSKPIEPSKLEGLLIDFLPDEKIALSNQA